jgi:hypothetical protein
MRDSIAWHLYYESFTVRFPFCASPTCTLIYSRMGGVMNFRQFPTAVAISEEHSY